MPADPHQQRDDVTVEDIVDLLVAVLATSSDIAGIGPDTPLVDLGLELLDDRPPQTAPAAGPHDAHAERIELVPATADDVAVEAHEEAHLVG